MFVLWTALPFDHAEFMSMLEDAGTTLGQEQDTLSGLVPSVSVKFNFSPAFRRQVTSDEVGVTVRAETLTEIRTWLEQLQEFLYGVAQSINDEEMTADLDEYMEQVMNNRHPNGHVMYMNRD